MLTAYGSDTIVYDNSGNPTSYRGDSMQWSNNQLTQQTHNGSTITYTYNESGLRTKKNVSGGTQTTYVWKDGVLCAMQSGTKVLEFSYSANGDVVSVLMRNQGASSGTRYYYARNAQGDVIGLVNSSGTMVIRYVYDSWGKLLTTTGTATIGTLNPFRYRGYIYDTETGLYYLKTRYYDPETGRFINADVLMSTGQGVIGCNMFCYCLNNPVNGYDPTGRFFSTIIGAITGAVSGAVSAAINGDNILAGAGIGAASGAIAGLGVDLALATVATGGAVGIAVIAAVGFGMAASAGEYAATEAVNHREVSVPDLVVESVVGGAFNLLSYGMANDIVKTVKKPILKYMCESVRKGFKSEFRHLGKGIIKIAAETVVFGFGSWLISSKVEAIYNEK